MNIPMLRRVLVEELQGLIEGNIRANEYFADFARASLTPPVRDLVDRCLSDGRKQIGALEGILRRLDAPIRGGNPDGMSGLLEELAAVSRRVSGLDPSPPDVRLVILLRKLLHYRQACLESLLAVAHVLAAGGIEEDLRVALGCDLSTLRGLAACESAVYRWSAAQSRAEIDAALPSVLPR